MSISATIEPFHLPAVRLHGAWRPVLNAARSLAERALALTQLNRIYARTLAPADKATETGFFDRAARAMALTLDIPPDDLRHIPDRGPLIVVANHPFGGVDAVVLASLLGRIRPDFRLLANHLLRCVPEVADVSFLVDPFGGPGARERNLSGIRSAMQWVRAGGALALFPSGEVSHLNLRTRAVTDPAWSETVARIARISGAAVLPVYFAGRNSTAFQIAGLLHPRLRTAMLPRELVRRCGARVSVRIGSAISPERLARFDSTREATEYLRLRTYVLKGRVGDAASQSMRAAPKPASVPIVAGEPADVLNAEIASLPADQTLIDSSPFRVLFATADQIPKMLREIGRLREITFRATGEGTGREIDLDRFDEHYVHLFVWNTETSQLVGAYRAGQTDELLARFGPSGLYTTTLFDFKPQLLEQISPALEMGRSFVVQEYQRDYAPLLLLWKGIGRFVGKFPRYRRLFGAVSISDEYRSMTKQLLVAFLESSDHVSELARLVTPHTPPRFRPWRDSDPAALRRIVPDMGEVEELVAEIESDRRGVPVLLRQYLKLNAKLLGFNVDPEFGDVIDGLVLVDLMNVDMRVLDRYMGRDQAAAFRTHHSQ